MLLACFAAFAIVGLAIGHGDALRAGFVNPRLIYAAGLLFFAAAVHYRKPWSRWLGLCLLVVAVAWCASSIAVQGFLPLRGVLLAVLLLLMWGAWKLDLQPVSQEPKDPPSASLVLLLREPVYLEPGMLADMASRAWGAEVVTSELDDMDEGEMDGDPPESFVAGESPHFICVHWPGFYAVNNMDEPYFDDIEEITEQLPEMRLRAAVEKHNAWLSVDLLHWFGDEEPAARPQAYRQIARLLAELADDNCLAIIDPIEATIFPYDPETERKLRSDQPLESLRDWYYAPILAIDSDDPRMVAATEEARRRWPEFVAAFEQRDNDSDTPYLIKAPFSDGEHTEYMWVSVSAIENQIVYGLLENSPAHVKDVKEGCIVRVPVHEVSDWLCVIRGEAVGGFTTKVLQDPTGTDGDELP